MKEDITDMALMFATLAKIAYENDNREHFEKLGFNHYRFIAQEGAQGHLAASDTLNDVIITCRGTEVKEKSDVKADLDLKFVEHGAGKVHRGFKTESNKLMDEIFEWVKAHPGKTIYVTGHSLGAAMALFVTHELEQAGYAPKYLFTFGQPRLGNSKFLLSIKTPHMRFVNCNDVVPRVPPHTIGYRHHGELCYINFRGIVRPLTGWQRFKDRYRAKLHCWLRCKLFSGVFDHGMDQYCKKLEIIQKDPNQTINFKS